MKNSFDRGLCLHSFTYMSGISTNPKIFLLSDAATRLACEIESTAPNQQSSDNNSIEIKHTPSSYKGERKNLRGNKTIEIISNY